jgi:uncharacterized protein (TIGR03435 family)
MRTTLLILILSSHGFASDPAKFEAASVKPSQCRVENAIDPGMVALHGDPMNVFLMEAFKVKVDQIVGPSWLNTSCFSIDATIPPGVAKDQVPQMLQALMVERFKLAFHKGSRLMSGYALVVDKNGPKLKPSPPDSPAAQSGSVTFGFGAAGLIKGSMSTAKLARRLSNELKVPVEDLTGLTGQYDIDVSWARDLPSDTSQPVADDVFTAVRKTLGLRLDKAKQSQDLVVIDHIEQNPGAN